jgi:hypothetical protein
MRWTSSGKRLYYAAAAYLAFAIMGTFTFMSFDAASCFEDLAGKSAAQSVFLTSLARPVECLAINTAKAHSFSLPRMALPAFFYAAGSGPLRTAVRFITMTAAHNKSFVPLKLRI